MPHLARVEIAGPGFVNLYLAPTWLHDVLRDRGRARATRYGTSEALAGQRINLEFVSANPTGPLHAGGGRWVAVGDAIANLLAAQGAEVHREYYLNDTGNQLATFRDSLYARYRGEQPPEDGYQGQYLVDLAGELRAELGDDVTPDDACEWGVQPHRRGLCRTTSPASACTSTRGSRSARCTSAARSPTCSACSTRRASSTTSDGARWLRTTDFGDSRDRVLVKSDGTTTYLCNDLAYHRDKLARGSNHLIDIWGADHHGQVKSMQAGMQALGFGPPPEPEVLLGQFVKLVRDGVEVRLSKRTGNIVTLADILDEVDPDVARMTFLLQGIDSPQTFDLDVVTSQSMENPVYYVQYAHARVSSIARRAAEAGVVRRPLEPVDLVAARRTSARPSCCARSRVSRRRRRGGRDARAAEGLHLGARLRPRVPRLLPRLPGDHRRRRAHAGAALAVEACRDRARERARPARRERARRDGAPRRGRRGRGRMTAT